MGELVIEKISQPEIGELTLGAAMLVQKRENTQLLLGSLNMVLWLQLQRAEHLKSVQIIFLFIWKLKIFPPGGAVP